MEHHALKRVFVLLICLAMISGSIPNSVIAAEPDPESGEVMLINQLSITVKDEDGSPVSGATIEYSINVDPDAGSKKTTNSNGTVTIEFANGTGEEVVFEATVSKNGFGSVALYNKFAAGTDQDIQADIRHTRVWGIEVTPAETKYTGEEFDACEISGTRDGDVVTYKLGDDDWSDTIPIIKEIGEYTLQVKVEREGYEAFETTVTSKVSEGIFEVGITALDADFSNGDMPLVTVNEDDLKDGDIVTYAVDGGEETTEVPERKAVGKYEVFVRVKRENYKDFETTCTAEIHSTGIPGLSAKLYNASYDSKEHEAVVSISGKQDGDTVEYCLNDGKWSENIPIITNAGSYTVRIRVTRDNYEPTEITDLSPKKAEIRKASQNIAFNKDHESSVKYDKTNPERNVYDFSANGGSTEEPEIVYSVKGFETGDDDIATIDQNGTLTITGGGAPIQITATVLGNENYEAASVTHTLDIKTDQKAFEFQNSIVNYTVGTGTLASDQAVRNIIQYDRRPTKYSAAIPGTDMPLKDAGLKQANEKITVEDFTKLVKAMENSGSNSLTVKVTAQRDETNHFVKADVSYYVLINFGAIPERNFIVKDPQGTVLTEPNGPAYAGSERWFNTKLTIELESIELSGEESGEASEPVDTTEYKIAKKIPSSLSSMNTEFKDSIEFGTDEEGDDPAKRPIYFRNTSTGAISKPVALESVQRLDCTKPAGREISITFDTKPQSVFDSMYYYFNGLTEITFEGYDDVSGLHHFTWNYNKEDGAIGQGLVERYENTDLIVTTSETNPENQRVRYSAKLVLPKEDADQLRGHLMVTATDNAGLTSDPVYDDGRVFVVDTIAPTRTVSFGLEKEGGNHNTFNLVHYFSDNVKFEFNVDESNFRSELMTVKVQKDGSADTKELTWNTKSGTTVNTAEMTLTEEGEYVVTIEGKDPAGHQMEKYTSPVIIIDKTLPEIEFSYSNGNNESADADNEQTVTIRITERNFRASDIRVVTNAVDIANKSIDFIFDFQAYLQDEASWSTDGDIHTASIGGKTDDTELTDAIYDMTLDFTDLALNEAEQVETGKFIVDHTAPATEDMEIIYSTPITESILEAITLGFYNPDVDVTFVAKDNISGVGKITWEYKRQERVSNINVKEYAPEDIYWKPDEDAADYPADGVLVEQDSKEPSRFTATVRLPKKEAEQLRGSLTFSATDRYSNVSNEKTDDGTVIIVDTIAPEMAVKYTEPSNTKGDKLYYNKNFRITLNVKEANFFAEDVDAEVSKDGGEFKKASVSWVNKSTDEHIGTYAIYALKDHSGDGDYVIRVKYKDRSNNEMKTYTSKIIVIDTIKPSIDVRYSSTTPANTLTDREGNRREYYNTTRKAEVTIKEHNFEAGRVKFDVALKNAGGGSINDHTSKTGWSHDGDYHTLTITYPGDANYTFDMECEDLATNKSADYKPNYFTVDKTPPTNLSVSYSPSILDTVLNGISFGFYNSKVTVTIKATDDISMINKFNYSYVRAAGVSSVNAELLNQLLEEAQITYSDGGATGATRFEIPRSALGGDNQFNGNVRFNATNRSGKESNQLDDSKRIVVDNISPKCTVEYNTPVNVVNNISYYDLPINVTITINEANFYSEDVNVSVTKDGGAYSASPSWSDNSTDVHVGYFSLTEDGDYFITVNYTDKSSNQMTTYTSEQLTLDTQIEEPVIAINGEDGNGKAYKDQVVPTISFEDQNFDTSVVTLTRTRYDKKDEDVTEQFINPYLSISDKGGSGTFDSFPKEPGVDGIYTLTVTMTDKAMHNAEKTVMFTVNRFGSVYAFNDYLISLINNGGGFVYELEDDLVITEYNADKLLEGSLIVDISKDGKPIDDVVFTVAPEINDRVSVGESGWYQYRYTISKENFKADGVYKVSISSKDATGNSPETANFEDKKILFRVDSTPPEINSITGLEKSIINAQNVDIKFNLYDAIGLAKVTVYVNGSELFTITDFSGDPNNYSGLFTLAEGSDAQSVRIVAEDLAGNITDTSTETFAAQCAYAFNSEVIVSTNPLVRAVAWTRAHAAVTGGATAAAAAVLFFIIFLLRRRKKEEETEEASE